MQWTAGILREAYRNWFVAGYLFRSLAAFEENLIRILTNICRKTLLIYFSSLCCPDWHQTPELK
jgi:hypothetical protein